MDKQERFDRRQLLALCAVMLLTPALRLYPASAVRLAGRAAWLSALAALPPLLGYLWFLGRFLRDRGPGEGLAERMAAAAGKRAAGPVLVLTGLWLLFYAAFLLRCSAERFITTIYPSSGPAVFALSLGLAAGLAALGPARSLVRVAKLVLPLLLGALGLILLTALSALSWEKLLPLTARDLPGLGLGALPVLDVFAAVLVLGAFFEGMTPRKPGRLRDGALWLCGGCLLLTLLGAAVLGSFGAELTGKLTRPFFYLVRNLVFFGSLERVEALVVALWVFPDFLSVAAALHAAQRCLRLGLGFSAEPGKGLKDLSRGRWLIPLCGLAASLGGALLAPSAAALRFLSERAVPLISLGFALVLLPGLYALGRVKKRL